MNTILKTIDMDHLDTEEAKETLRQAGEILQAGGLVGFPTETVYGLGANALEETASAKIYAAKGRPSDNPLIVHIAEWEALASITKQVPGKAEKLAKAFWPGPLTMIFEKNERVPLGTTGGLSTVAVRMPNHPAALQLIRAGGGYIAAPSANTSGRPSPTLASHVAEDMNGKIEMILDGGPVGIGLESTIVDMTVEPPMILRPGYITREMLTEVIGPVEMDRGLALDAKEKPKAPGMKYKHYAPRANLMIVEGAPEKVAEKINALTAEQLERGVQVGIIGTDETMALYPRGVKKSMGTRTDDLSIANHLYAILREFDELDVQVIYSESFDGQGMGQAIMNRLLKAAGHQVLHVEA